MSSENPEQIGAIVARVLLRLERVQRGLSNAIVGVQSMNVSIPRAIVAHHSSELNDACSELRTAEGEAIARAVPERVKAMVLLAAWSDARNGFVCAKCKGVTAQRSDMQVDHITPLARGGSNDRSNLQALCRPCNLSKGASV